MSEYTDAYVNLLIKQYWEKPNARGEIAAQAATWEKLRDLITDFGNQFDIDQATGDRLDIIGDIVGLPRTRIEFADDNEYRFFLKVKIAKNSGSAYMVSDIKTSVQDVIRFAFDNLAYVIDKQDMSLSLQVDSSFSVARLQLLFDLGLLPKPQGVRYSTVVQFGALATFGFSNNIASKNFASRFDVNYIGGVFARKVII